ncbi:Gfo/Idh/MocA family protein [Glutamicibacter endophyticus]|uniref:Gfo/Idh/MocA family protein n=1 Tax=Glutamicibacter endophyticus TaxID=1522174 RepID=UPI003AEFDF6F
MTSLRVGIIGGGFMARTHAQAARRAGGTVCSVLSSSPESTARAASQLGAGPAASLTELLETSEIVHVTSPNSLHAEHALAVLRANKPVICEKPLGVDFAQASALASAATQAGMLATVPFVYRFHPMARQARAMVAKGHLGRLLTVRGAYLQDWLLGSQEVNWRVDETSGGPSRAFADIGSHLADLTEFIAGERITELQATTSIAHEHRAGRKVRTEDAAVLTVRFSSGALGSLMVSQVNAGRKNALSLELSGTEHAIEFHQERPDELWIGGAESNRVLARDVAILEPDAARLSTIPAGHPMGYLDAFAAFVADSYAALGGECPEGLPTFDDGARAALLTDAVLRSAAERTWVSVDDHRHEATGPTKEPV